MTRRRIATGATISGALALAASLTLTLNACGTSVNAEAECYRQAHQIVLDALASGIPSNEMPSICGRLAPEVLDGVSARLRAQVMPLLVDTTGQATPAYRVLLDAKRAVSV